MGSMVEAIMADSGRVTGVRCADGWSGRFDAVCSNGDVVTTYKELLGAHPRGAEMAAKLSRRSFSPSLFVTYFGLKGERPDVKHHTILFGHRYKGLLDEIYKGGQLAEDFSLYLHHPTATDPAMAPAGHSAFYVLSPVPHLGKLDIDWEKEAPRYADSILDALERRCIPNLKRDLVTMRTWTPKDFETVLGAHQGSAFSLEPVLWQSAYFRTHNRDDALSNLYFVGAGTHPGAGIPGVVGSAKATGKLMIEDLLAKKAA
jgi:phytoene desaturase